jgi:hypothetical protein
MYRTPLECGVGGAKGWEGVMVTTGGCGRSDMSKRNEIASQRGTYGAHDGSRMGSLVGYFSDEIT